MLVYNKVDQLDRRPRTDLDKDLVIGGVPTFESIGKDGSGTFGPFKSLEHRVIDGIHRRKSWWEGLVEPVGRD